MFLQAISLIGAAFLLVSYILLIFCDSFKKSSLGFHVMNFIGCVILSLTLWFGAFNLGSFVLQVTFALVALFAVVKSFRPKNEKFELGGCSLEQAHGIWESGYTSPSVVDNEV